MSVSKKEMEKKLLIKRAITSMNKQIQKLEEQKQVYIRAGKEAKQQGLKDQYNLALSGLKATLVQQKRVYEMKLNFEISSQMRDMNEMTSSFLQGMGILSKDMAKLTKEKDFAKIGRQFNEAMANTELQTERLEAFMDDTQAAFSAASSTSPENDREIEEMMEQEASVGVLSGDSIDRELEELKKKMI